MDRFWNRAIKRESGCWEWQGYKTRTGYGFSMLNSERMTVHRMAYHLTHGPIPVGMNVCHTCDNRCCMNPEHLFLGSQTDNMQDKVAKGRHHNQQKTHCKNNHEYTEENTYLRFGKRYCRACVRSANKVVRERKAAQG